MWFRNKFALTFAIVSLVYLVLSLVYVWNSLELLSVPGDPQGFSRALPSVFGLILTTTIQPLLLLIWAVIAEYLARILKALERNNV